MTIFTKMEKHIFQIPEIECMILNYLNLKEQINLLSINKYFYEIVSPKPLYKEMIEFHVEKKSHGIHYLIRLKFPIKYHKKDLDLINNFFIACELGFSLVIKYYFANIYPENIPIVTNSIFPIVCRKGNFDIVKWLEENCKEKLVTYIDAFMSSCIYGRLEIAQYLYSKNRQLFINNLYPWFYEEEFNMSCRNGHIDVVKYLVSLNDELNINFDYEDAFQYSCENGHLEVVKWLYSLSKKSLDHKFHSKNMFHTVCGRDHTEVAKWLVANWPNKYYLFMCNGVIVRWYTCV